MIAQKSHPDWKPNIPCRGTFASNAQGRIYGFKTFGDYFTPRQLVALTSFSDLVQEAREKVLSDAKRAGWVDDGVGLENGDLSATAYGEAVATYLGFVLSKQADLGYSLCRWESIAQCPRQLFGRQAIPMVWDFAESNLLSNTANQIFQYRMSWWSVLVSNLFRDPELMKDVQ